MSRAEEAEDAVVDRPTVDPAGDRGERRPGWRAAGLAAARIAAPIIARQGGGVVARLKADWPAIIGPELADSTWPASLARGGALKLIVAPAKALEVQHRAPFVIDRINLFLGRRAVSRLALIQGVLPLTAVERRPLAGPVPGAAAALDRQLAGIADPELRAALVRLGHAVIATS